MFNFDHHDKRLKVRVAGPCIRENYVLLTKTDHDDYWILPGGRVELLEDTSTALQREMFEETGHSAQTEDPPRTTQHVIAREPQERKAEDEGPSCR